MVINLTKKAPPSGNVHFLINRTIVIQVIFKIKIFPGL